MYRQNRYWLRFVSVIAFISIFYLIAKFEPQIRQAICGSNNINNGQTAEAHWGIIESSVNAQVIWQKENPQFADSSRSDLVAAHGVVVQKQEIIRSGTFPCNDSRLEFIAYDVGTGQEQWRLNPQYATSRLYPLENGFLLVNNASAAKIESQTGAEDWEISDTDLPLRSIRQVYDAGDFLYVVSHVGLHQIDNQSGEVLKTVGNGSLMAFYGDYTIESLTSGQSSVKHLANKTFGDFAADASFSLAFGGWAAGEQFISQRFGDFLIVTDAVGSVGVYRLSTGEFIWRADHLNSAPLLLNNAIIFCDRNLINIYELESGQDLGVIRLSNGDNSVQSSTCAATSNTLLINFADTGTLIAVRIDL